MANDTDCTATVPLPDHSRAVFDAATGSAVACWETSLASIYSNSDRRLDASHYDPKTQESLQVLKDSGHRLTSLADLATVYLPSQFVRIWAKDRRFGIPYVNATDLMSLMSLGVTSSETRFLSRETDVDFDDLVIREGYLLVSCSGTIGRVFYVPPRLDGWVATHDIIRVVPGPDVPIGYLHAFLTSELAQRQILGHTHGGQIDHITEVQLGATKIPILSSQSMESIHQITISALNCREQALSSLSDVTNVLLGALHS